MPGALPAASVLYYFFGRQCHNASALRRPSILTLCSSSIEIDFHDRLSRKRRTHYAVLMASEKPSSISLPPPVHSSRRVSPSPHGLRQRTLGRASTFAEGHAQLNRRRSSLLSETLSETRKSLRSSTDDILLPRATTEDDVQDHDDNSHWQSLPLVLALLPAVGGLLFKNGSAVITDLTLLGLAAIFMNWALRSPW